MERVEKGRPITLIALIGLGITSVVINVVGAFLTIPEPWNYIVAAGLFFVEIVAFMALVNVAKDFNQPGVMAKAKAVVSFVVFLAMCAIGVASGHRALSEVDHLMSAPAQRLEATAGAELAQAEALERQAAAWRDNANGMRGYGYMSRAADLEDRAINAEREAITLRASASTNTAEADAKPVLGGTIILLLLIVNEIAKSFGRFLFAFPASWLVRRKEEEVQAETPAQPVVEQPVLELTQRVEEAVPAPRRRVKVTDAPPVVGNTPGYVPKKRILDRRVDPALILNSLIDLGAPAAAIYQARALFNASGGEKIGGIYQPEVAYAN